jgi:putative hydrolase of the HAD superfamily
LIKNAIFDIGNVLLSFKPKEFLLNYIDDIKQIDIFVSNIINSKTWLNMDQGILTIKEAKNIFLGKYPELTGIINIFYDNWLEIFSPIDKNINILKELKKNNYKIYALSNFIEESFHFVLKKFEFFSLFDGMVISYNVQLIKPEVAIYQHLLDKYKLVPNECVFLDDYMECLIPAQKLGIFTILINKEVDLRAELRKLSIKI